MDRASLMRASLMEVFLQPLEEALVVATAEIQVVRAGSRHRGEQRPRG